MFGKKKVKMRKRDNTPAKNKKLTPFQENIKKINDACDRLESAGYELSGSPSGVVTVLKVTKIRTLASGYVVKEFEPVYRGKSYIQAAETLLTKTTKSPKKK